jgi:hypothetical protein
MVETSAPGKASRRGAVGRSDLLQALALADADWFALPGQGSDTALVGYERQYLPAQEPPDEPAQQSLQTGMAPKAGPSLTVSIKSWHYTRLFILHMRNDGCERTV